MLELIHESKTILLNEITVKSHASLLNSILLSLIVPIVVSNFVREQHFGNSENYSREAVDVRERSEDRKVQQ